MVPATVLPPKPEPMGRTLYSSSTEKAARKSSQWYSLFPKPEENKHRRGFEL